MVFMSSACMKSVLLVRYYPDTMARQVDLTLDLSHGLEVHSEQTNICIKGKTGGGKQNTPLTIQGYISNCKL